MNNAPIAPATPPDLRSLFDNLKAEIFQDLNSHKIGTIVEFDADLQTASVQIATLLTFPNGDTSPYPLLTDCPVFIYSGGGAALRMPVMAGDPCLVLFSDADIDNWYVSGNLVAPNTARSHSLSDGFVLVGFYNRSHAIPGYSSTDFTFAFKNAYVNIDDMGNVVVHAPAGKTVTINSADGGTVTVSTTVRVANGATDLKTALDALFSALLAWVNTGGSTPSAGTVAALTAAKALVDSLLT